jgi:hypothetical protein
MEQNNQPQQDAPQVQDSESVEKDNRVTAIVAEAQKYGAGFSKILENAKPVRQKSVLPGKGPESYVERKMREKREEKQDKEIKDVINEALDPTAPINSAKRYIQDAQELTNKVVDLSANEGVQAALSKIDELVSSGQEKAVELSQRINISIRAFHNDMQNASAMSEDLEKRIDSLTPLIPNKNEGNVSGEILRKAAELDAVTSAANWSMATMFGLSAQSLLSNLDEAVEYTKDLDKQSVTDVNVVTDVVPK